MHTSSISQNLIRFDTNGPLPVHIVSESNLIEEQDQLRLMLERNEGRALGLSGAYRSTGELAMLAVADASMIIIIEFESKKSKGNGRGERSVTPVAAADNTAARQILTDHLLRRSTGFLYAFDIAPLALALFQTLGLRIANAIDMQCAGPPNTRAPLMTIKRAIGDLYGVLDNRIQHTFSTDTIIPSAPVNAHTTPLALRAWIAHFLSQLAFMEDRLARVPQVDTFRFSDNILAILAKSSKDSFQLEQKKPTDVTRHFTASVDRNGNTIRVTADQYTEKIRKSQYQCASIVIGEGTGRDFSICGAVTKSRGRTAQLTIADELNLAGKVLGSIRIVGRSDLTQAESHHSQKVLEILQGLVKFGHENPWVHLIFLSSNKFNFAWPSAWTEEAVAARRIKFRPDQVSRPLNPSQTRAVKQMLEKSDDGRFTIIQGPPGTGKTTVIASFVQTAISEGLSGIWLIAQSNVAVKNIAEKLDDFGLTNWKLLVSRDFFEEWHEHLYTNIRANIIISEEFNLLQDYLKDCPVVLCTLSMLSSVALHRGGGFTAAPIKTLVIDEASQIKTTDYISLFTSHSTIRKVCFIGDDKQLPPHGQDDIQDLKSIFDANHLKDCTQFLDTQYRMPPQIGDFISKAIYGGQLKSDAGHPITDERMACHFINIPSQEWSYNNSWKNIEECQAILQIAAMMQAKGKRFRIITPYVAQRSLIEKELEAHGLEWEDKCFSVDSFQGNEEDHIIISLVRSSALGFLADTRRTNVMLTRCKRGMIICTSRKFLKGAGSNSLVGSLLEYYDDQWIEKEDLVNFQV